MTITEMPTEIPTDARDADRIVVVPKSRTIGAELQGIDLTPKCEFSAPTSTRTPHTFARRTLAAL